jgi:hypothetical protein
MHSTQRLSLCKQPLVRLIGATIIGYQSILQTRSELEISQWANHPSRKTDFCFQHAIGQDQVLIFKVERSFGKSDEGPLAE